MVEVKVKVGKVERGKDEEGKKEDAGLDHSESKASDQREKQWQAGGYESATTDC